MMNRKHSVLGIPLAALVFPPLLLAQSPPSFQPAIYLNGSAVRESVDSDPSIITGMNAFSFDNAILHDDGTVSGSFSQLLSFCADVEGNYDATCATGAPNNLVSESSGVVTCLAKDDETGDIWFAGRLTYISRDPRINNEAAYAQAQAEVTAGRYLTIGRLSDRDGDNYIDHTSFFSTPTLAALPNVMETGHTTQVTDLKSWEKALDGPVTAENACLDKDAFFLRFGTAEVLPGNKLRFTHKKTGKLFGEVYDGRFPIPRSAPPASVVDYSDIDLPTSATSLSTRRLLLSDPPGGGGGGGGGGYSGGGAGLDSKRSGGGGGSYYEHLAKTTATTGANGYTQTQPEWADSDFSKDGRVAIAKLSNLNCDAHIEQGGGRTENTCCRDVRPYDVEFVYTGAFEYYTVPETAEYCVAAWGAQGGGHYETRTMGGWGARITGTMTLEEGEQLRIGVGGRGIAGKGEFRGGGGGGASSVVKVKNGETAPPFTNTEDDIVVMAAGGGGAGTVEWGGPGRFESNGGYESTGGTNGEGGVHDCEPGGNYGRCFRKVGAGGGFLSDGGGGSDGGRSYLHQGHRIPHRVFVGTCYSGVARFGGGGNGGDSFYGTTGRSPELIDVPRCYDNYEDGEHGITERVLDSSLLLF